jgi:hypothetical protein
MTNRNCPSASHRQVARVRVRLARAPTRMATTEDSRAGRTRRCTTTSPGWPRSAPPQARRPAGTTTQILAPTPTIGQTRHRLRCTCASSGAGTLEPLEPDGSCGRLLQVFRQRAASFLARARQRWMGLPWTGVCPPDRVVPDRVVPDGQARPRPMPSQSPGSRLLGARSPLTGGCWRSALAVAAGAGVWRWATARGRG